MPKERTRTVEAALGQPSTEHFDVCGTLQVPYLSRSWREIDAMKDLGSLPDDAFRALMVRMLGRRLPALTEDQILDGCGPEDFVPWYNAAFGAKSEAGEGND